MGSELGWVLALAGTKWLKLKEEKILVKLTEKVMGKTLWEKKLERATGWALEMKDWKRGFERSNNILPWRQLRL